MLLKDICPSFSCPSCKKWLNFFDLRTFVAKFCRKNLRIFSADFFDLKSKIRRHFYFLDVWFSLALSKNILSIIHKNDNTFDWTWGILRMILMRRWYHSSQEPPCPVSLKIFLIQYLIPIFWINPTPSIGSSVHTRIQKYKKTKI